MRKKLAEHNEFFNAASHYAGFLLAVAALVILVVMAARLNKTMHIVVFSIYGATLCLLYLSSAVYHTFCGLGKAKITKILQRVDHCAIFLLIAGTYTPCALVVLKGGWGWTMFGLIWGLAVTGIVMKILIKNPDHFLPYAMYGVMGWLALVAIGPLAKAMSAQGLLLLFGGGVSYTIGAILLAKKTPKLFPGKFSYHELWHLFVISGSAFHFFMMFSTVLPNY